MRKMECFIKKVFASKIDGEAHRQFVRFGKGIYTNRAAIRLVVGEKIKLRGGSEFANDFVNFVSEIGGKFTGIILSKEPLDLSGKKKGEIFQYDVVDLDAGKIKEIKDLARAMLLDASAPGIELKMKKKLPKPGKGGSSKIDDKFCMLEADAKYLSAIKQAFFWDVQECKKASATHDYKIDDIIMPPGEKDFVKIRLMSKRKGKITRKLVTDGVEKIQEQNLEA
ncbi:MAG: hypothetical protein NT066_07085 [Candidatus Omnitrophica bacterium]|nr:hypothetical protein [Candidatus Omnitrophota bacterium]